MEKITMPIHTIGESNWIEKLTAFLENYDVGVLGLDAFDNDFNLSKTVVDYYTYFGGIDSSDFMYNLYRPEQFIQLSQSTWSFVKEHFTDQEPEPFIVFAESPGNDPVCFNKDDFSAWLFSHDPLKKAKVFEDFNQYLQYEIIELQKLMGDVEFANAGEELEYHKKYLGGKDIDYHFREMKFL
ncbi:hypothetical protein [Niabella drilacis]|uniref:SUKH-4 immunity protein n=1 Tax=Niabella drilacis (strain DSM 25811 / CCM 8410 / CCUG 62505 / LMG 26954 / E90) TaxID=1285928 RepID=A0A1G6UTK3_NIADE|nr:hypothetical protein [Niabella drilacis]SDD44639.1 hypothetical protein SAMN04487894_10985 [Niabella drilacis]